MERGAEERGAEEGGPAAAASRDEPEVVVLERDSSTRALLAELVPEIALLAISIYLFVLAGSFESSSEPGQLGPGFWPRMAAAGLAIAVIVRMIQTVVARNRPIVKVRSEFDEFAAEEAVLDWTRLGIGIVLAVAYVLATMFVGYLIATALFLAAFIWIGGQRQWYVPLIAVVGALVLSYVFIGVVFVSLPTGVGIFDTVTVAVYQLLGIQ